MKDIKAEVAKRRLVALYQSLNSNWFMVDEVKYLPYDKDGHPLPDGERRERVSKEYVRISEPIEVQFSALADDSVIQNAVAVIDEAERAAIRELNEKIVALRQQKAQLLALTHQPETV